MDVNRNNGEKHGNDGYDGGFGSNYNTHPNLQCNTVGFLPTINQYPQQPDHFQNDVSNDLARDINFAYEGYGNQSSYGFGPNNYVPQLCNPTGYYYVGQPQQQLPSSHLEYGYNSFGNALTGISNLGYSNHPLQQIQAVQESPMNFEVPSTQLSNKSDNFVDDFAILDISQNKNTLQGKDKLLSQMTDDEICAASGDFNPFCVPVTPLREQFEEEAPKEVYGFNQDPEIVHDVQQNVVGNDTALKTVFVEPLQSSQPSVNIPSIPLNQSKKSSENAKVGSKASTKKPGPGRPPTYKNEEERKEARRKSSNKYERRIKQGKDEKRQKLEKQLVVLTNINLTLRQRLINGKTELANYKQASFNLLTENQKKIFFQKKEQMLKRLKKPM